MALSVLVLCVIEVDLELLIFLSLPPRFWDYRCTPPCPALRIVDITVFMGDKCHFLWGLNGTI